MGKKLRRPTKETATTTWWRRTVPAALILIIGFGVYANALHNPFVFDDAGTIQSNISIQGSLVTAFLHPQRQTPMAGRPLSNLSIAINYAIDGLDPFGYHIWNLVTHVLAAVVLFALLRRLSVPWPLASTAIWLVHPLTTEVVNYVTQRTESMAGFWVLTTVYASTRAWVDGAPRRWLTIAFVANLCGLATKESALVSLPLVILCDRAFHLRSWRALRARARFYAALMASWLLSVLLLLQTPFVSPAGFERHVSRWTYLFNQPPLILQYLRLAIWPTGLLLDYGFPEQVGFGEVWVSATVVAAAVAAAIVAFHRAPRLGFWAMWFFITLAPASSVIPIPTEVGAERRMYLPLIGVVVLVVSSVNALVQRMERGRSAASVPFSSIAETVALLVVMALGVGTIARNAEYHTTLSIWQSVLDRKPNARAHENVAVALRDIGRDADAIAHLRIAASELPSSQYLLGSALIDQGQLDEGIGALQTFVARNPNHRLMIGARQELGAALVARNRFPEAIDQFEAVLKSAPNDPRPRRVLATTLTLAANRLLETHQYEQAETISRRLVALEPNDARAHNDLGAALASQMQIQPAAAEFAEAVRLDPSFEAARANLNQSLAVLRR